jgi:tetratricopeptide (TPR) repeat protein
MKSLAWTLCFVVALQGLGIAQVTTAPGQKKPAKPASKSEVTELLLQQQRAIALLESLVKETIAFDDQSLRVQVQAKIADALWKHKQSRAREIFIEAFQATGEIKLPEIQNKSGGMISDKMLSALFSKRAKLRQDVLQFVVTRDAELAEKLRASVAEKPVGNESDVKESKSIQEMQNLDLARSLAKSEPQKAAQIVRQTLATGYNPNIAMVLTAMRSEHSELANTLFLETLAVARKSSGSLGETVGTLSFYFLSDLDRLIGNDPTTDPTRAPVMQPFLNTMLEAIARHVAIESEGTPAVQANAAAMDYIIVQQVTPFFAKFMPDALPTIRLRSSQLAKHLPTSQTSSIDRGLAKPDYEAALKEAETATDTKQKDRLYMQAASQAIEQGKYDEATRLTDKIQDRDFRFTSSSVVRYQIALKALNKGEFDAALRYAKEIDFSPQRVLIYQRVAEKLIAKRDYQRATEILTEIERWLETSAEDPKKAKGLLDVAGLVSSFDPMRGFEVTKLAVKAINNTEFKLPARTTEIQIKIDSLDFARAFTPLARADFERALLIAQSMQKKEAAVIAQVEICKAALEGTQTP